MRASDTRAADRERIVAAVQEAGATARKYFGQQFKQWTKGAGDSPVTEADIAANEILQTRLRAPGDGWLSEESENDPGRLSAQRVWVVDPIDGTRSFIAGREDWSISAALVEDGRPVVGAVFAPVTEELFVAIRGQGATRNGVPMQVRDGGLDGARVGGPKRMLEHIVGLHPGVIAMPRVHSLALRLTRVAQGELDAAIAGGQGHDWDLAAADLLVHEAAGMMTALDGTPLIYNRPDPVHSILLAAGPERHAALIALVRDHARESR